MSTRLLAAVAALACAGCAGGGESRTVTAVATETNVTTVFQTVTAEPEGPPAAPALTGRSFRVPTGNIGCAFDDASRSLRCDILSGLRPEPEAACELDWVGIRLDAGGAEPQCAGDTAVMPGAPVLPYGREWGRGGLRCESRRTGLRCRNVIGDGFFLSRASWRLFD